MLGWRIFIDEPSQQPFILIKQFQKTKFTKLDEWNYFFSLSLVFHMQHFLHVPSKIWILCPCTGTKETKDEFGGGIVGSRWWVMGHLSKDHLSEGRASVWLPFHMWYGVCLLIVGAVLLSWFWVMRHATNPDPQENGTFLERIVVWPLSSLWYWVEFFLDGQGLPYEYSDVPPMMMQWRI